MGPAPSPQPSPGDNPGTPPAQVTPCGLVGNNCEVATGTSPDWVAIADFDEDGANDVAVANYGGDSVSIFLNDGLGTLTLVTNLPAGSRPHSVVAADFNGDTRPDIAVGSIAAIEGPAVTVFLNQGQASFSAGRSFFAGGVGAMVTAADLDQSGALDLIVAQPFSDQLALLPGLGDGSFDAAVGAQTSGSSLAVAAADLDGDGSIDLATASEDESSVTLLFNDGPAGFFVPPAVGVGTHPQSIAAADFNGDGLIDLVTANNPSDDAADGSLSILLNNGNRSFGPAREVSAGANPLFVVAVDLDGDQWPDLAIADLGTSEEDSGVGVLFNNGDATFGDGTLYAAGLGPAALAAGDLDGDGDFDLAIADFVGNSLYLLGNDGFGR